MSPVPSHRDRRSGPQWPADLFVAVLALWAAIEIALSLHWRMEHDTPALSYVAWSIVHFGAVPYRDLFETSFPGTFLFHIAVGTIFGWSDRAFHTVDFLLMIVLIAATYRWLRGFGRCAAAAAALLFILYYLKSGPEMTLQRDYVGLIAVVVGIAVAVGGRTAAGWRRLVAIGLLFGYAATIKPQLAVGLVPIGLYLAWRRRRDAGARSKELSWVGASLGVAPALAAGLVFPGLVAVAVLIHIGAWSAFLEMVLDYLPLHLHMTGEHVHIEGFARMRYLVHETFILGGVRRILPAAFLGLYLALRATRNAPEQRAILVLLTALTLLYGIYPAMSGQFWPYHWMPFKYFITVCAALILTAWHGDAAVRWRWPGLALAVATALVVFYPPGEMIGQLEGKSWPPPEKGAVDRLAADLEARLRPGDTVQPLDWINGAIQAMLISRAQLATPFLYDYTFYHDVENPVIVRLRARFMADLEHAKPRFVIAMKHPTRVSGKGSSPDFPALTAYLAARYKVSVDDPEFLLLERIPSSS